MELYKQQLHKFNNKYENLMTTLTSHFIETYRDSLEPPDNNQKHRYNSINSKLLEILKAMTEIECNIDNVILELETGTTTPKTQDELIINKTLSDFTPLIFLYMMTMKEKNSENNNELTATAAASSSSSHSDVD